MRVRLMVLPSREATAIRVVSIPADVEAQEAFRHVTGVISEVEEVHPDYRWEDIEDALDAHGYQTQEFVLGPTLG